jgi:alpha-D-xyloside xylohydrolase
MGSGRSPAVSSAQADRPRTRLLETKELLRVSVARARVREAGEEFLLLDTSADCAIREPIPSPERELEELVERSRSKTPVAGSLRIDLVSDAVLRVRYAEGDEVPENRTAMVVGAPPAATRVAMQRESDRVVWTTPRARVTVRLDPLRIELDTPEGEAVCAIGGREKNYFGTWDGYNTGICRSAKDGSPIGVECFDLHSHEAIFGLGEKFIRLNKMGQTIDLSMQEALGCTTPRSYKNIPFFASTRGYGVFLNHSCRITAWIGSMSATDLQVALEDDFLDYYLILGNLAEILPLYTDITGKGQLPPLWSFGFWQSKISYRSAEECLEVVRRLRAAGVPLDVIHLDTFWFERDWYCDLQFDAERFPDPPGFISELGELGVQLSLWQLPYIPEGSQLFEELSAVDGFVKDQRGRIYDTGICYVAGFKGVVGCIDYTNPEAKRVHQKFLRRLFELGVKAIKVDFGEQAPIDGVYFDGTPGERAHNLYPLLYNQAVAEVTEQATGENLIWARSAWAGSQRYPLHWGGDSSANWHNMVPQLEGGLSFGLSGFQFWSQDIGGFVGHTGGELLIRWMQFGTFLSHSRIHGMGKRELYEFEPEVLRICRDYIRLRYRLLPYIYGSAISCVQRSLPMARALVIDFQDDPNVWNLGDQYLFGDFLLVAPITTPNGRRELYLPRGVWRDWWTGERLEGSHWIQVQASLEKLPLYLREGSMIPMGPEMSHVGEFPIEEIALRVAPFEGDGESFFTVPVDHERVELHYRARGGRHSIEMGRSKASFTLEVLGGGGERIEVSEGVRFSAPRRASPD